MSLGIQEPEKVLFTLTFQKTDQSTINYIRAELEHDDWACFMDYDEASRTHKLTCSRKRKAGTVGKPAIVQGPPPPMHLGKRAWETYRDAVGGTSLYGKFLPIWDDLGERQREGWAAAAMEIYDE